MAFMAPSSEAEVDGQDPLRELRQRRLLPQTEPTAAAAAEEVRLGLEPAEGGPGVQVAPRKLHAGARCAQRLRPGVRQRVRYRYLPQLGELGVVDQIIHEVVARADRRDALGRELGRVEVLLAPPAEERAAHARVAVELAEPRLEVDQGIHADSAVDRHGGRKRTLETRRGAAQ